MSPGRLRDSRRRMVFDRPMYTFVRTRWLHGVDVLVVTPPPGREISQPLGGSIINAHKWLSLQVPQVSRV